MDDYLSSLNEQQRDAVVYCDGPELVIAGAGSGKTRVLTHKIVHLLAHGFEPWRIMALTFTNKAAREMRERIQALVGTETASRLWMGTFHSIFARLLRRHAELIGYKSNFTIYDQQDSRSVIKAIIKDLDLDEKVYKPNVIANSISNAKNALIGPAAYAADRDIREADRRAKRDRTAEIYAGYVQRCRVADAMDFDDLLFYMNVLLRDNPDIRHHYQDFFRYILVDEYQDTNFAQHLIVQQLCSDSTGLCVVGDDAQSIYSFRGANIRNILNLKNAFPNLAVFKLEQNYRSTQNIINAANSLIAKNREQIPKTVFSRNSVGERIEVVRCYSDFEEGYMVANGITRQQAQTGDSYDEFAILYRTNAQSRVLEEALRKRAIPYRIYGGLSFYQRKEVKDAIAYFRMAINPDDDEALKRIINYPARGIGDTTLNKVSAAAIANSVSMWQVVSRPEDFGLAVNKGTLTKLAAFAALIRSFIDRNTDGADASTLANEIIAATGLMTILISDKTPESVSKRENLEELLSGVHEFVETKAEEGDNEAIGMADFLAEVSLATDQDETDSDNTAKVTMMTIHAAKGLEFGNVFIVGAEENLLPAAMSADTPQGIEEERRLLYVAITRAKRFCMISYAGSRYRNGQTEMTRPSRFLADIDVAYLRLTSGKSDIGTDPTQRFRDSFHSSPRFTPPRPSLGGSRSSSRPVSSSYGSQRSDNRPRPAAPSLSLSGAKNAGGAGSHSVSELSVGTRIAHDRFGFGSIIEIDTSQADARIKVRFDNVEVKTLMLKFVKFKIVDK